MYSRYDNNVIKAVCVVQGFRSDSGQNISVKGVIYLEQKDLLTTISGKITGLIPNQLHAIHIHEFGDLTDGCTSACAHYNPFNMPHGFPSSSVRHIGDLGNLKANSEGTCEFLLVDNLVKLDGQYSVIGRSIVIHNDPDDGGLGGHNDSLVTGHAGARIACGVIGHRKNC
jgi:superoxide dismutase, Cu-Zn family